MIHFKIWASGQATLFLITLFLWISNSVAVALICFYLFIRKKQAMLVSSHLVDNHNQLPKKPITTIHEISPVTFQSFFNPELLKTYSYRRSLFYLNEKKRHLMFGLGQP